MVTEHLMWKASRQDRAGALYELVACAVDAIRWRLEPAGDPIEEASLNTALSAVHEHVARMARPAGDHL